MIYQNLLKFMKLVPNPFNYIGYSSWWIIDPNGGILDNI